MPGAARDQSCEAALFRLRPLSQGRLYARPMERQPLPSSIPTLCRTFDGTTPRRRFEMNSRSHLCRPCNGVVRFYRPSAQPVNSGMCNSNLEWRFAPNLRTHTRHSTVQYNHNHGTENICRCRCKRSDGWIAARMIRYSFSYAISRTRIAYIILSPCLLIDRVINSMAASPAQ